MEKNRTRFRYRLGKGLGIDPPALFAMYAVVDWLKAPEQTGLRRAFTVWVTRVLLRGRMPGVNIPEMNELQEVQTMLAERVIGSHSGRQVIWMTCSGHNLQERERVPYSNTI